MCNAHNHRSGCDCGFGRPGYCAAPRFRPLLFSLKYSDFCRPTTCPHCHQKVFFIQHNGGSLWVDELGWPWPKHEHLADSGTEDLYSRLRRLKYQAPKADELQLSGESVAGLILKVVLHSGGKTYLVDVLQPRSSASRYQQKIAALLVSNLEQSLLSGLVTVHWDKGSMSMTDENGNTVPATNKRINEKKLREFMASSGNVVRV